MDIKLSEFKKSINKSDFTNEQIAVIWEFYVTNALVDSASQRRRIQENYGYNSYEYKMLKYKFIKTI